MPTTTSQPLSSADIALLRDIANSASGQIRLIRWGALALGAAAVLTVVIGQSVPSAELVATYVVAGLSAAGGVALFWVGQRQRRKALAPVKKALQAGTKWLVSGHLNAIAIVPGGLLRYTIDAQTIDVAIALGVEHRRDVEIGRPLRSIRHLADTDVVLHCVELESGRQLLTQAHYPLVREAVDQSRPAGIVDRGRATRSALQFLGYTSLIALGLFGIAAWAWDFEPEAMINSAVVCAVLLAFLTCIVVVPPLLRARKLTHVRSVAGPVTEVIQASVRSGKSSVDVTWYRVGGMVHSAFEFGAVAQLGNQVRLEWLSRDNAEAGEGMPARFEHVKPEAR